MESTEGDVFDDEEDTQTNNCNNKSSKEDTLVEENTNLNRRLNHLIISTEDKEIQNSILSAKLQRVNRILDYIRGTLLKEVVLLRQRLYLHDPNRQYIEMEIASLLDQSLAFLKEEKPDMQLHLIGKLKHRKEIERILAVEVDKVKKEATKQHEESERTLKNQINTKNKQIFALRSYIDILDMPLLRDRLNSTESVAAQLRANLYELQHIVKDRWIAYQKENAVMTESILEATNAYMGRCEEIQDRSDSISRCIAAFMQTFVNIIARIRKLVTSNFRKLTPLDATSPNLFANDVTPLEKFLSAAGSSKAENFDAVQVAKQLNKDSRQLTYFLTFFMSYLNDYARLDGLQKEHSESIAYIHHPPTIEDSWIRKNQWNRRSVECQTELKGVDIEKMKRNHSVLNIMSSNNSQQQKKSTPPKSSTLAVFGGSDFFNRSMSTTNSNNSSIAPSPTSSTASTDVDECSNASSTMTPTQYKGMTAASTLLTPKAGGGGGREFSLAVPDPTLSVVELTLEPNGSRQSVTAVSTVTTAVTLQESIDSQRPPPLLEMTQSSSTNLGSPFSNATTGDTPTTTHNTEKGDRSDSSAKRKSTINTNSTKKLSSKHRRLKTQTQKALLIPHHHQQQHRGHHHHNDATSPLEDTSTSSADDDNQLHPPTKSSFRRYSNPMEILQEENRTLQTKLKLLELQVKHMEAINHWGDNLAPKDAGAYHGMTTSGSSSSSGGGGGSSSAVGRYNNNTDTDTTATYYASHPTTGTPGGPIDKQKQSHGQRVNNAHKQQQADEDDQSTDDSTKNTLIPTFTDEAASTKSISTMKGTNTTAQTKPGIKNSSSFRSQHHTTRVITGAKLFITTSGQVEKLDDTNDPNNNNRRRSHRHHQHDRKHRRHGRHHRNAGCQTVCSACRQQDASVQAYVPYNGASSNTFNTYNTSNLIMIGENRKSTGMQTVMPYPNFDTVIQHLSTEFKHRISQFSKRMELIKAIIHDNSDVWKRQISKYQHTAASGGDTTTTTETSSPTPIIDTKTLIQYSRTKSMGVTEPKSPRLHTKDRNASRQEHINIYQCSDYTADTVNSAISKWKKESKTVPTHNAASLIRGGDTRSGSIIQQQRSSIISQKSSASAATAAGAGDTKTSQVEATANNTVLISQCKSNGTVVLISPRELPDVVLHQQSGSFNSFNSSGSIVLKPTPSYKVSSGGQHSYSQNSPIYSYANSINVNGKIISQATPGGGGGGAMSTMSDGGRGGGGTILPQFAGSAMSEASGGGRGTGSASIPTSQNTEKLLKTLEEVLLLIQTDPYLSVGSQHQHVTTSVSGSSSTGSGGIVVANDPFLTFNGDVTSFLRDTLSLSASDNQQLAAELNNWLEGKDTNTSLVGAIHGDAQQQQHTSNTNDNNNSTSIIHHPILPTNTTSTQRTMTTTSSPTQATNSRVSPEQQQQQPVQQPQSPQGTSGCDTVMAVVPHKSGIRNSSGEEDNDDKQQRLEREREEDKDIMEELSRYHTSEYTALDASIVLTKVRSALKERDQKRREKEERKPRMAKPQSIPPKWSDKKNYTPGGKLYKKFGLAKSPTPTTTTTTNNTIPDTNNNHNPNTDNRHHIIKNVVAEGSSEQQQVGGDSVDMSIIPHYTHDNQSSVATPTLESSRILGPHNTTLNTTGSTANSIRTLPPKNASAIPTPSRRKRLPVKAQRMRGINKESEGKLASVHDYPVFPSPSPSLATSLAGSTPNATGSTSVPENINPYLANTVNDTTFNERVRASNEAWHANSYPDLNEITTFRLLNQMVGSQT